MIAALPNLQVRAIGQRQPHAQKNLVRCDRRNIDLLDPQILAAVKHGRGHFRRNDRAYNRGSFFAEIFGLLCSGCSHACVIRIFNDSAVGRAARSSPSWILSKGNRWVTISITGSFRESTRSAAGSWMSIAAL